MADGIDVKLLDQRVAQRYLRKGLLDEKDYKKYLDALPDLAEQAEDVESTFEATSAAQPQHGTPVIEPGVEASEE